MKNIAVRGMLVANVLFAAIAMSCSDAESMNAAQGTAPSTEAYVETQKPVLSSARDGGASSDVSGSSSAGVSQEKSSSGSNDGASSEDGSSLGESSLSAEVPGSSSGTSSETVSSQAPSSSSGLSSDAESQTSTSQMSTAVSSANASSASGGNASELCTNGSFTDGRDGRSYRCVTIGAQTWMAENLDFGTRVSGSSTQNSATATSAQKYCYNNDTANCAIYGGLYQWHTALALAPSCDNSSCSVQISSKHRGICPEGWHIPSENEWNALKTYVDSANGGSTNDEGRSLKGTTLWSSGTGTDDFGWGGRPGGNRGDGFTNIGKLGLWWVAAESGSSGAVNRKLSATSNRLEEERGYGKNEARSIRCVKD